VSIEEEMDGRGDEDNGSATLTADRSSSKQSGLERYGQNRHQGCLRPDRTR